MALMGLMLDMGVLFYSSRVENEVKKKETGSCGVCERIRLCIRLGLRREKMKLAYRWIFSSSYSCAQLM